MRCLVCGSAALDQPVKDDRDDDNPATDADQPGQKTSAYPSDTAQRDQSLHDEFLSRLMFYLRNSCFRSGDRIR